MGYRERSRPGETELHKREREEKKNPKNILFCISFNNCKSYYCLCLFVSEFLLLQLGDRARSRNALYESMFQLSFAPALGVCL